MPESNTALDTQFVQGFLNYLHYWQTQTATMDDAAIARLDPDFPNVLQAIEMGLALPDTQREAAALMQRCFFWIQGSGRMQHWSSLLDQAITALPPAETYLRLRLLLQLGQLQRLQNYLATARETFTTALAWAEQFDDARLLTEVYINLGQTCQRAGDLAPAADYGRQALAHLPPDQPRLQMIIWQMLGRIALRQGQLEQAETWLRQARAASQQSTVDQARNTDLLARVLQQQERYDAAVVLYQTVIDQLHDTPHVNDLVNSLLNLGGLYFHRELYAQAEATFRRAEQLLHEAPALPYYRAWLYNNLGCVLRELASYPEAERYFQQSLTLYRQVENNLFLANAHGNLAGLYARQARNADARRHFETALSLLAPYPDHADAATWRTEYEAGLAALSP